MSAPVVAASALVLAALAAAGFGPALAGRWRERGARRRARPRPRAAEPVWDPGRELRAERRARELLRSVVPREDYEMYEELGFLTVAGRDPGYAYLLYPHRPVVAYDTETGELLSEYCVSFRDDSEPALGGRLPAADDVLAKWMSLRGGERELVRLANMHMPGWQVDPGQVRRDLRRLGEWRLARRRGGAGSERVVA